MVRDILIIFWEFHCSNNVNVFNHLSVNVLAITINILHLLVLDHIPRSVKLTIFTPSREPQQENASQKTTENLLTFEKHYIHLLSQFVKNELADLSDDIKFQIKTYIKVTGDILQLHREQIYPDLNKCGQNIGLICSVFRTALEYNSLEVYETYTAFVPRAYQVN